MDKESKKRLQELYETYYNRERAARYDDKEYHQMCALKLEAIEDIAEIFGVKLYIPEG
jgi:hypothetical protein